MSNKNKKTFIDLCLEGKADLSKIDDYIEKWHTSDEDCSLHNFLGMEIDEYSLWVKEPEVLSFILYSRTVGKKDSYEQRNHLLTQKSHTQEFSIYLK